MCPCRFMRSLNSLASVSSAEGGGMRALLMATPFAAAELQAADLTPYSSAAPGALTEFLPGGGLRSSCTPRNCAGRACAPHCKMGCIACLTQPGM
jgi:hypothetical protein